MRPCSRGWKRAGFRLEFGEDGTGWPLKFRTRGGGYYFNVGCSELIADGKIRLIQAADIEAIERCGLRLKGRRGAQRRAVRAGDGLQGPGSSGAATVWREVARRVGRCLGI